MPMFEVHFQHTAQDMITIEFDDEDTAWEEAEGQLSDFDDVELLTIDEID